jgi:hypothetical protein
VFVRRTSETSFEADHDRDLNLAVGRGSRRRGVGGSTRGFDVLSSLRDFRTRDPPFTGDRIKEVR